MSPLVFNTTALVITILIGIYTYFKIKFSYWKRKGVPYIEPTVPFGSLENPFKRTTHIGIHMKKHYDELKTQGCKGGGIYYFSSQAYLCVEPEYIKNVMAKDFQYFCNRGIYQNEKDDPMSCHLLTLTGTKWRNMRAKLTPTFTSKKMKMMFDTVQTVSNQLIDELEKLQTGGNQVEIKHVLEQFTMDVIGSCAFGVSCNSFTDKNNKFVQMGLRPLQPKSKIKTLKDLFCIIHPKLGNLMRMTTFDAEVNDFFVNFTKDSIAYRKENNVIRNDFMQLLMNLVDENSSEEALTVEEIAAQLFVFFLAGYDTSSTAMAFCLYELALNVDIQEKVRAEVVAVCEKYNGELTYESLNEMEYLDQVMSEALRKYPPGVLVSRLCERNYKMPTSDVVIEKGTRVVIPIYALHYDPEYFPEPEKFDPDRFNEENRAQIKPYTYLPFGGGPRVCIASRFGTMQSKIGIAAILKNFQFRLNKKTEVPISITPYTLILCPQNGIWLDFEKVTPSCKS